MNGCWGQNNCTDHDFEGNLDHWGKLHWPNIYMLCLLCSCNSNKKKKIKETRIPTYASFIKGHFALLMRSVQRWRCASLRDFPFLWSFASFIILFQWCYNHELHQSHSHQSIADKIKLCHICGVTKLQSYYFIRVAGGVFDPQEQFWSSKFSDDSLSDWIRARIEVSFFHLPSTVYYPFTQRFQFRGDQESNI